jgi:CSLREA domain-containing protein
MMANMNFFLAKAAALLLAGSAAAQAALQVTTTADSVANDGQCSLREAISAANSNVASGAAAGECGAGQPPPFDRIDIPAGTFRLQRSGAVDDSNAAGDLDIRRAGVQLIGAGADVSVVRGDREERVFDIGAGLAAPAPGSSAVVLRGLTIRDGDDSSGGGVRTAAGWGLEIDACTIANNAALSAGGILAQGPLLLRDSTLHANSATDAAGIGAGGLRYTGTDVAQLRNVTFNANESLTDGGGALFAGPARLNNVTFAANSSDADFNDSGDGALIAFAPVEMSNTLLATNIDFSIVIGGNINPDCAGSSANLVSLGYNLIGNLSPGCQLTTQAGDQSGTPAQPLNARLQALGANGGPTETQMPGPGSPAQDRGAPATAAAPCEALDQRGVARPRGPACDIGAAESDDPIFADGFQQP